MGKAGAVVILNTPSRGAADLIASRIPPGQIRYMNEDPKMYGVEKAGDLSLGSLGAVRVVLGEFCCGFG